MKRLTKQERALTWELAEIIRQGSYVASDDEAQKRMDELKVLEDQLVASIQDRKKG